MKLYGCLLLFGLILCIGASSRRDSQRSFADFDRSDEVAELRRGHLQAESSFDAKRYLSTSGNGVPLLNITVIHRGFYFVTVKINFLRNEIQDEFETESFFDGTNKVFNLQKSQSDVITFVRIRFHVVGSMSLFGDFQIQDPTKANLCFVLSGTAFTPVYSICAPDEDYSPHNRTKEQATATPQVILTNFDDKHQPSPFLYHMFSPPLKLSMLRRIHCRRRLPRSNNHLHSIVCTSALNQSQNCTRTSSDHHGSTITPAKRSSSLINIDYNSQRCITTKFKNIDASSLSDYYRRNDNARYLSTCIRKHNSDSILEHMHQPKSTFLSSFHISPYNTNSSKYDSTIDISPSISSTSIPQDKTADKTWRLKIHDHLNKDGSRHFVVHKGSEESVRQRREEKRAKRSEEKKRKIDEKISQANQRWQKYSNIDYDLVFFISRYYDRLPLCSTCRNYFVTHQTHNLLDDPRASLDYVADEALRLSSNKNLTLKQAAKSRLIKDYDKQTDLIFHLCDECLSKCEQIRNELKQISAARKASPNVNITPAINSPSFSSSPASANIFTFNDPLSSPSPSTSTSNQQQQYPSTMPTYSEYHQMKLKQLYEYSQNLIVARENQQYVHGDLELCLKQMQYHCLEILRSQYPGLSLSFPYTPSSKLPDLTYRHDEIAAESDSSDDDDDDDDESTSEEEDSRECECESVEKEDSRDDRVRIQTCHGLVEYCNAPLDDFIRGLEVLKCLSNFNRYPV
ncbi:unnamed protein product [Adineta ricciae]|uniref:Uncharacterized protein n=1 Tax=Adineta ricciae TaxID=249248 RepID=A0A814YLG6_ADIRI|nr:unnamed protein product [Adineta ricciae]